MFLVRVSPPSKGRDNPFLAEKYPTRQGEKRMPYVNIKITEEGVTSEQKEKLIKGVTDLLKDILGKNPATTFVVIEEIPTDNWGVGGEQVTARRKRGV
jgi:4-oxalocrotonate tautomerase